MRNSHKKVSFLLEVVNLTVYVNILDNFNFVKISYYSMINESTIGHQPVVGFGIIFILIVICCMIVYQVGANTEFRTSP